MKNTWLKRILSWSLAAAMLIGEPAVALAGNNGLIVSDDAAVTTAEVPADIDPETLAPENPNAPKVEILELDPESDPVSITDASDEASVRLSASNVTVSEGSSTEVLVEGAGVSGNYVYEVSGLTDTSAAGFADAQDGSAQTLTVSGLKEGTNLCTVAMRDVTTGAIAASKTLKVNTIAGDTKGGNSSAYLTVSKTYIYVAQGSKVNLYLRANNTDAAYAVGFDHYLDNCSMAWGEWDGGRQNITLTGNTLGTEKLTVYLYDRSNGGYDVVDSKEITIKVVPRNTITTSWSSATVTRSKYKDLKLGFYGKSTGAKIYYKVGNPKKVRVAWLTKSASGAKMRIRGLQKGTTYITFALKKNGVALRTKKVKVTVKDQGVIDYAWKFVNSSSGMNISNPSSYVYPYSVFSRMYGDNALARRLWNQYGHSGWGGDCYGMATTSGIMYNQNLPASFKSGAIRQYSLGLGNKSKYSGLNVKSFIQSMMWSQVCSAEQNRNNSRYNNRTRTLTNLVKAVKSGSITAIGIQGYSWYYGYWGHELLAYKCVTSGSTAKVYYYDPNYSNEPYYITFYKSGSNYTSWSFQNSEYESEVYKMTYTTYNEYNAMWSNRGHLSAKASNLVTSDSDNFELLNADGKVVATVKDGKLVEENSNITQILPFTKGADYDTALYVPTGEYTIRNTDPSTDTITVSMTNVDHSAQVKTNATSVNFSVADRTGNNVVSIANAKGADYAIRLESSATNEPEVLAYAGTGTTSTVIAGTTAGALAKGTNATAVAAE